MAPWDELTYYNLAAETVFTNQLPLVMLCRSNPMRVGLGFSTSGPQVMTITTNGNAPQQQGVSLSAQQQWVWFNARDHPVLTQAAWFNSIQIPMGLFLTVVEITMKTWPVGVNAQQESSWLSRLIRSLRNT